MLAVVSGSGQTLRGDRAPLGARAGLERVEQGEPERLLQLGVAVELDIRPLPEAVEVGPLLADQPRPARVPRLGERRAHLIAHGGRRALSRPAVGQELDHLERLPGLDICGHHHPPQIREALGGQLRTRWTVDHVVDRRRHRQTAGVRGVDDDHAAVERIVLQRVQRRGQRGCGPRIGLRRGHRLVGDELGLDHDASRALDRLDLIQDRRDGTLRERHEPDRAYAHSGARRGDPLGGPGEQTGSEIERPLVAAKLAVADIERLVLDEQANDLAVGHVDHGLAGVRKAVFGFGVRERANLVEAAQVGAREAVGLTLIEVPTQPDMPIR